MASLPPGLLHDVLRCSINMWIVLFGHLRACCSPIPFSKAQPSGAKLAIFAVLLHHSLFASSQGSHPQASRQALVSAILFQFVCGTCGHFQVPSLPYETGKPWAFAQGSLSLLNNTITSFFFFSVPWLIHVVTLSRVQNQNGQKTLLTGLSPQLTPHLWLDCGRAGESHDPFCLILLLFLTWYLFFPTLLDHKGLSLLHPLQSTPNSSSDIISALW